jgi:hypothetical protein
MSYSNEGEVWTVMYRNDKKKDPWLKIAATLGGNWTPIERCQEIARRLEIYRQDGLTQLTYRSDPNTPKQFVICAKTNVSGDNCPLLVTLKPNTDPYSSLRYMTEKLTTGTSANVMSMSKTSISFGNDNNNNSPVAIGKKPLVIDLEQHLADEDRKERVSK